MMTFRISETAALEVRQKMVFRENINNRYRYILSAVLIFCLLFSCAGLLLSYNLKSVSEQNAGEISVTDSGFYSEEFEIEVHAPNDAVVYYTEDNSIPDEGSSFVYNEPIRIIPDDEEAIYNYKFLAVYGNGRRSQTIAKSYIVGKNIKDRYNTLVLSVSGDEDELFGYDNGIFVKGRLWDEYWKKNPDADVVTANLGANFNQKGREFERAVNVVFFDENGEKLVDKNMGLRIFGTMSRVKNQKSFKLTARKIYDGTGQLKYPFFRDMYSEDGNVNDEFKSLIIRNSGNDNGYAYIRNELSQRLAKSADFPDYQEALPITVYVNGTYMGIYWMLNNFDEEYFEGRYGDYDGRFVLLSGNEFNKTANDDELMYADEYNEEYERLISLDLTDDDNLKKVTEFMDIESYLKNYAFNYYIGNHDWPKNNYLTYRYVSPDNTYVENSVFDGKYHFVPYDLDWAFGLIGTGMGLPADSPLIYNMADFEPPSLFDLLMKREDCRTVFFNYMCDLMNGVISPDNLSGVLDEMNDSRYYELFHMLEETDLMLDSVIESDENQNIANVERELDIIREYPTIRPMAVFTDLKDYYPVGNLYYLCVNNNMEKGKVRVNSYNVADEFKGLYLADYAVELTPVLAENEVFDHWEVNGEAVYDERLKLFGRDYEEEEIVVNAFSRLEEPQYIRIDRMSARGSNDYIVLSNPSGHDIYTFGYYLSDSDDKYKYSVPAVSLKAGESLVLYGSDYSEAKGLGGFRLNFNLSENEILSFSYMDNELESIKIPGLSFKNGEYVRDEYGIFTEMETVD